MTNLIHRIKSRAISIWNYCAHDVWRDSRSDWRINLIKTLNLSVRSFLNSETQARASALTFNTILAIVPALALLFAIGRGFGFQNLLQSHFFKLLPIDQEAANAVIGFVDSYLAQSSEGLFVGVGIVMLLWTIVSLMNNVEGAFNTIWGIKHGRNLWRKAADYTAMLLILPILIICASGLQIFLSTALQGVMNVHFMTPLVETFLQILSYIVTWLFFSAVYMLIPYTKVKFKNAMIAGVISGSAFLVLQWIFVSGQMYVARYNAIYGSFAFLPLLLIWIQLSWVVVLSGCVICYSAQNIYRFNFEKEVKDISADYSAKITIATLAVIIKRFEQGERPVTISELASQYDLPPRLVSNIINDLINTHLITSVVTTDNTEIVGYQPAIDINKLSISLVTKRLRDAGHSNFIPTFDNRFSEIINRLDDINNRLTSSTQDILIKDININLNNN